MTRWEVRHVIVVLYVAVCFGLLLDFENWRTTGLIATLLAPLYWQVYVTLKEDHCAQHSGELPREPAVGQTADPQGDKPFSPKE